jgi:hypothetical protein
VSDKAVDFAGPDMEREPMHGELLAVAFRKIPDLKHTSSPLPLA